MKRGLAASLVALALLVASTVRAEDDAETAAIRRDFDALIRRIEMGPQPDADSPTAVFNRLVSADPSKLRAVLDQAWRIAGPQGDWGSERFLSVRWAIHVLHGHITRTVRGLPEAGLVTPTVEGHTPASLIVGDDGVVRIWADDGHSSGCWNCDVAHDIPRSVDALTDSAPARAATSVDPKRGLDALVEQARAGEDSNRIEVRPEEDDFARAVGEACGADDASRTRLLALAAGSDPRPMVVTAAAWMRAPETVPTLRSLVRSTARRVASGDPEAKGLLAVACRGLAHVDRAALEATISGLTTKPQDAALAAAGLDVAEPLFAKWIDAARDPAERVAVLDRAAAILRDDLPRSMYRFSCFSDVAAPPAPSGSAIERLLLRCAALLRSEDEPTQRAAVGIANVVLGDAETPGRSSEASSSDRAAANGAAEETVRPYPTTAIALRTITADVASRALSLSDGWISVFDAETQLADGSFSTAASDAGWPAEFPTSRFEEAPSRNVRFEGKVAVEGLRVTITNLAADPVAFDPATLRRVEARRVARRARGDDKRGSEVRELNLTLGWGQFGGIVPASSMTVLAQGKSLEFTIPLRSEDRKAARITISILSKFRVRGRPAADVITQFHAAPVK